ncbi:hypothetical protein ACJVC5_02825 [Peredibacter sp. HCB2-198]|uniref:DUF350 domain-containing protein n=1 Tax=Peredibacter sp. HCB2-198 TaxID=3383025 RepID=UPI0038B66FA7
MAEIFDRLVIRLLLALFVCFMIWVYRYAHVIFYPTVKRQVLKKINPAENPADALHLFSRLVGIALIFSSISFNEASGFFLSIFHFAVWGTIAIVLYLLSLFIIESIVFYNFDYTDEILKRKNMCYAFISFCHAIVIAFLTRTVMLEAENSLVILLVLWLYMLVIVGFSVKYFTLISRLTFNKLMMQKNLSLCFAYGGFTLGAGFIIASCFDQEHYDITVYCIQVLLKTILSLIIFPIFKKGLMKIFPVKLGEERGHEGLIEEDRQSYGYGFYEGAVFIAGAILTTMIVNRIQFGTIYPFF